MVWLRRWVLVVGGGVLAAVGTAQPGTVDEAVHAITAAGAYATMEHLVSPRFGGRLTGTPEFEAAAVWAAEEFLAAGLRPPEECGDFLQPFPWTLGRVSEGRMWLPPASGEGEARELEHFKDFLPMFFSGSGEVEAEVVFVGFGMTAPELDRDDYAGLDVTGKVVMAVRGAPRDGRDWNAHNSHRARAANARSHGAAAFLFAEAARANPAGEPVPDLVLAAISEDVANELLGARGLSLAEVRKVLEVGGSASFATGRKVRLLVRAGDPVATRGVNVAGVLAGSDPLLAGEYVLVGAHLDHVGDWPELLPGANDNASGAAALLEIVRAVVRLDHRPPRSLVFVLFGGEEVGLLGSRHWAANPPASLGRCIAMLNMDMVGVGTGAWVSGGVNFPEVFAALEQARDRFETGLTLRAGPSSGEPRADHGPFQAAGIPAVSLFGMGAQHRGYHTPEDSLWWITPRSTEAIARVVLGAAVQLAGGQPSVLP